MTAQQQQDFESQDLPIDPHLDLGGTTTDAVNDDTDDWEDYTGLSSIEAPVLTIVADTVDTDDVEDFDFDNEPTLLAPASIFLVPDAVEDFEDDKDETPTLLAPTPVAVAETPEAATSSKFAPLYGRYGMPRFITGPDAMEMLAETPAEIVDVSVEAFNEAYGRMHDTPLLSSKAIKYSADRGIAPMVALRRGVSSGKGAVDLPATGPGRTWTSAVNTHVNRPTEFVGIPWHLPSGGTVGQIRYITAPRTTVDDKGTTVDTFKFDFPCNADGQEPERIVDALHANHSTLQLIAEGQGKTDNIASRFPGLSVIGMAGVDGAAQGRNNESNTSRTVSKVADEIDFACSGVEGKDFIICADADFATNPGVHNAIRSRLAGALLRAGAANVYITQVPDHIIEPITGERIELGADAGIDDYAVAMEEHYPEDRFAVTRLLAEAMPHQEALRKWKKYDDDDTGRAERLAGEVKHLGGAYIPASNSWRYWSGKQHEHDSRGSTVRLLASEVNGRAWGFSKAKTAEIRAKGRGKGLAESAVEMAKGYKTIHGSTEDWQPREFANYWPAANGTVNLDTEEFEEGVWYQEHMVPFVGPVNYVKGAQSAVWDEYRRKVFLRRVDEPNECGTYLHENGTLYPYETDEDGTLYEHDPALEKMFGQCVGSWYHSQGFRIGLICKGAGQSGLGTLVNAILATMGEDAHGTVPAAALVGKANQFTTSSIPNTRVVLPSELQGSMILDESTWRLLTQDADRVTVEVKGFTPYKTQVTWSMVIMTNDLPKLLMAATSHNGNRSRAVIAEFPRTVSDAQKDDKWEKALFTQEAQEAILAWAVMHAKAFADNSHKVEKTERCIEMVKTWLGQTDRLAPFIEDMIEERDGLLVTGYLTTTLAWHSYRRWAQEEQIPLTYQMKKHAFLKELAGRKDFGEAKRHYKEDGTLGPFGWLLWELKTSD